MRAYTLAEELAQLVWNDALILAGNSVARSTASQLFRAVGSVAANIAEGYSRSSGKDRARMFEYALGSARECMVWYQMNRPLLADIVDTRLQTLEDIRRILLFAIPLERQRPITKGDRPSS